MSIFDFKKRKNKQEVNELTTLEQIRKAYEDLSEDDKKTFHQSISDRVHESIAAQERADGNKDSQSAEAREHEALGAEHAAGRGAVSELHEKDDSAEEKREDKHEAAQDRRDDRQDKEADDWRKRAEERMDRLEEALKSISGGNKVERAAEKYGMQSKPSGENTRKTYSEEDVAKLLK